MRCTFLALLVLFASIVVFWQKLPRQWTQKSFLSPIGVPTATGDSLTKRSIVAYGWIEGMTESVEIRAQLSELISAIEVKRGDWVRKGTVMLMLDDARFAFEEELARAELAIAEAKLLRIETGYRDSEVEAARNDFAASAAELDGARKNLARLETLLLSNNVSQQAYDDEKSRVETLMGLAAAAKNRLSTLEAPPRADDLMEAQAAVAAAHARLKLAALNHSRTRIEAPIDGRVLSVNANVGELTQPDQIKPLIVLSDVRHQRAVVEIDEFDALAVKVGQHVTVTTDSQPHELAQGFVTEVEPQMTHKQMDTSRPGAQVDTFVRRAWISLENIDYLPVGLPIEVNIDVQKVDQKDNPSSSLPPPPPFASVPG